MGLLCAGTHGALPPMPAPSLWVRLQGTCVLCRQNSCSQSVSVHENSAQDLSSTFRPTPAADLMEPSGVFALCVAELGRVWPRHGGLGSVTAKEHGLGAFEAAPARRGPGQPQLSWASTSLSWATIRTPRPS